MKKNKLTIITGIFLVTLASSYAAMFHNSHTTIDHQNSTDNQKPTSQIKSPAHLAVTKIHSTDIQEQVRNIDAKTTDLNSKVLQLALTAYEHAEQKGIVKKPYLTIIDYSKPSFEKRMWIVDLRNNSVPFHTYVAHGVGSGNTNATRFSDQPGSKESSLGTFVTANTYYGHKGLSLRLDGLEKGFNDKALSRAIVIHGAWYVNPDFINKYHRTGRSWGCPAIETTLAKPIIDTIKNGSVVFAYYPNQGFLDHSQYA